MKNWQKVLEFCDQSLDFNNFLPLNFTKCCDQEIQHQFRKSAFSYLFCNMSQLQNLRRDMAM